MLVDQIVLDPLDIETVEYDFTDDLELDETLVTDSEAVALVVESGTDEDVADKLIGDLVIAGNILSQSIGELVAGVIYILTFTIDCENEDSVLRTMSRKYRLIGR